MQFYPREMQAIKRMQRSDSLSGSGTDPTLKLLSCTRVLWSRDATVMLQEHRKCLF